MQYPRLNLRHRSRWAAASAVLVAAATFAVTSAGAAPASARTASSTPTESMLVHQLSTCLPPGQARPTVVLVHGAWADASSWSGEVATLQAAGARRPEFVMGKAAVDPGPFHAAVIAAGDANAARRGEQRAVLERGDAGHEHALQRPVLLRPAPLGLLQKRNAVNRADHNRVGCGFGALDVGSAVRQQNHRATRHCAIASHGQHNPEAAVPTTPEAV